MLRLFSFTGQGRKLPGTPHRTHSRLQLSSRTHFGNDRADKGMQFTAGQIAEFLNGDVDGDAQVLVHDVAKIEEGRSGTLTFLANPVYTEHVYTTKASVLIAARDFRPAKALPKHLTLVRVDDPERPSPACWRCTRPNASTCVGIEQPSFVSPRAKLANDVYVGAFTYIADDVRT
jgi:UDP-3-O-[3-hydroxymyristoyl] glucosamine N-acyltransferase